jgi:hypothetical protein
MPLGSNAVYVPANFKVATKGMTSDEDYIFMNPDAPLVNVLYSDAGWDRSKDRCEPTAVNGQNRVLAQIPVPYDFILDRPGETPNAGWAVLMPDGKTIFQTQPGARCEAGGPVTSFRVEDHWNVDIYGDGMLGCHGASQLSCIGGTLRLGELRPGQHPPRHVLKINMFGKENFARCYNWTPGMDQNNTAQLPCYRWPAITADGYSPARYWPANCSDDPYCIAYGTPKDGHAIPISNRMGALTAIPPNIDLNSLGLKTEVARMIAWTLQNYGAYLVDDTAWDVYAMIVEQGPEGDFLDQFKHDWGFDFGTYHTRDSDWEKDIYKLYSLLHVVDNNGPNSVGGGGTPRQPLAPAFAQSPSSSSISSSSIAISSSSVSSSSSQALVVIQSGTVLEAETAILSAGNGLKPSGVVAYNDVGEYFYFRSRSIDANINSVSLTYGVPSPYNGNIVELRLGSVTGELVGALTLQSTAAWETMRTDQFDLTPWLGVQDLYVVFKQGSGTNTWVGDIDKLTFAERPSSLTANQMDNIFVPKPLIQFDLLGRSLKIQ